MIVRRFAARISTIARKASTRTARRCPSQTTPRIFTRWKASGRSRRRTRWAIRAHPSSPVTSSFTGSPRSSRLLFAAWGSSSASFASSTPVRRASGFRRKKTSQAPSPTSSRWPSMRVTGAERRTRCSTVSTLSGLSPRFRRTSSTFPPVKSATASAKRSDRSDVSSAPTAATSTCSIECAKWRR